MIILYVDDSVTMQKIAEITLHGTEHEYVGARNAEDALRLAAERPPAMVLADAVMPGMTGYELCKKLRALPGLAEIPILIVCGNSEAYDAARGEDAGATGSIAKPWDTQLLLDLLGNYLRRRPTARTPVLAPSAPAPAPPGIAARAASRMGMPGIQLPPGASAPMQAPPPPAPEPVPAPVAVSMPELEARAEAEKPRYVDENVQFTIYRPKVMPPAKWHPLLAFAHLAEKRDDEDDADPIEEVARQARQVLGDDAARFTDTTQDATAAIPAEGELTITPELPGCDVNPRARTFLWTEPVHREEFRIRAGAALEGQTVRGKVTVWLGSMIIAEVPLAIRVANGTSDTDAAPVPAKARAYRKIFASYSHRDSHIVDEVSRLARALGDEYTRDWVHLRSGQVWNDQLRTLIAEADIFQLFWSTNSMRSRYCREEWEYALSLGRPVFVRPTYWEDPMPNDPGAALPPEELVRLHFQKIRVGADWVAPPKVAAEDARPSGVEPAKKAKEMSAPSKPKASVAPIDATPPKTDAMAVGSRPDAPAAAGGAPWLAIVVGLLIVAAIVAWLALR